MNRYRLQPLVHATDESSPQIDSLAERLEIFYNTFRDYPAFCAPQDQAVWLKLVWDELKKRHKQNSHSTLRVLEAGAGLGSDFSGIEGLDRAAIHYTAQDISALNSPHLTRLADAVHVGPLRTLQGQFDVIFSLFVLEHIPNPGAFLSEVDRLLGPGGTHIVICPRYDFPGYVCPSMRHMRRGTLFRLEALRAIHNLLSRLRNDPPAFWVNTEPAVFHRQWVRDADAVHIVSQRAIKGWHLERGYRVVRLRTPTAGPLDWVTKRLLTLSLAFAKPPAPA